MRLLWVVVASAAVLVGSACGGSQRLASFRGSGITFRYPADWIVAPAAGVAAEQISPPRLAVMSFRLPAWLPLGDCTGSQAIARIPASGALVFLLFDGGAYLPKPRRFNLQGRPLQQVECFGPSYAFRFSVNGHGLQAFVALGRGNSRKAAAEAVNLLDSLQIH